VDERGRLILTPALHEPEELFADRPPVRRVVSVEAMDAALLTFDRRLAREPGAALL
jgi:hypothetical protein